MFSCAWLWIYAGLFLILSELLAPGFILCFFGLAAVTVGGLRMLLGEGFDLTWQLAAFSGFSVLYIVLIRRWFRRVMVGDRAATAAGGEFAGRIGKVTEPICPPHGGRVLIGDSEWTAVSEGSLAVGTEVRVVSQHNLTLKVKEL